MTRSDQCKKRQYRVFVSSTYLDNEARRRIVEDAIQRAGMLPIGMERFGAKKGPPLETCLKKVRESGVLVGIIAWRYGALPEGLDQSFTEIEYAEAKERLMFVIDPKTPVNHEEDYDPGPDKWKKQELLDAFKKRISKENTPAFFKKETLGQIVLQSLIEWREEKESKAGPPAPSSTKELAIVQPETKLNDEIRRYCEKAESWNADIPVAGFVTQLKVPIDIDDIYIPLRAMINLSGFADEKFLGADHAGKQLRTDRAELDISLPDAFKESEKRRRKGIVILGDPGSGKTTHLKRILLCCLRRGPEAIGLPAEMLPVFLPLRDLEDLGSGLGAFIQKELEKPQLDTPKGFGKRLMGRGNLLFLLDGLDEVADLAQREKVSQWIGDALKANPSCRFVVSCRYAGYSSGVELSEHFLEMHVKPFTEEQAGEFIHKWFRIVETGLSKDSDQADLNAADKAGSLVDRLREPDFRARRVFELTRNPLLLTNLCLVHRHRGSLPRKRARLYEECIDVLLEHWQESKGLKLGVDAQQGRQVLQPAALWLHQEEGRTRATAEELAPVIEPALKTVKWEGGSAEAFLRRVRDESGLLTGWDQEHYGFMHLGFQEYLAAREIRTRSFKDPAVLKELASHFGESWWREVGLLLVALEDPSLFEPYMNEVVKLPAFAEHSNLIEEVLDDTAEISAKPFLDLARSKRGRTPAYWKRQLAALRILERLDPEAVKELMPGLRKHPWPEIRKWAGAMDAEAIQDLIVAKPGGYELVRIPGGTFMMGSPETESGRVNDEGPQHKVYIPDLFMGRYPVTNEEYELFMKTNPKVLEPKYWGESRYNQSRHPVVGVSWDEAKRYAEWAGLHLPTEAEWEYACRAGTKTRYYTGEKESDLYRAGWYSKNSGGQPHPVGEKEPNRFGLYDMHGNVREWVEDKWHGSYKDAPTDGRTWIDELRGSYRVFRGGSWVVDAPYCRSAVRFPSEPVARFFDLGFRLSKSA